MARALTEEDRRGRLFIEQRKRRAAADDRRALRLRGSSAARQALQDDWEPVLAPEGADAYWAAGRVPNPTGVPYLTPRNGPERDDLEGYCG